ncbi:MAG: NRDE family protein [Jatrophihabitantaceae bacterium]
MCTVVCRWSPGTPLRMLALRDEFVGRAFDGPDAWWPGRPDVIGGRDRKAGGTWCACDVCTGVAAVVLNRPDRLEAEPGAASRGVLPLLAVEHGTAWAEHVDVAPMASFNLLLATPDALTWWTFDGTTVQRDELAAGAHVAKPRGLVTGPLDDRITDPDEWMALLGESEPKPDPSGLLVRIEREDRVYATVFGQVITSSPGFLNIDYSFDPQHPETFRSANWGARPA